MTNKDDFLPKGYEVPSAASGYMKFAQGENKFRVLSKAIVGWEYWIDQDGKRKPLRKRFDEPFTTEEIDGDLENVRHFIAFVVWNHKALFDKEKEEWVGAVQILEITQKGIQRTLTGLNHSEDWGSPTGYDIAVFRTGEGLETTYEVVPSPPKEMSKEIASAYRAISIDLEALYDGNDPFNSDKVKEMGELGEEFEGPDG